MTIEINGMAHVILTVSRFEVAREFYREFGMKPVFDGDKLFYRVGARTAIGIEPCDPALAEERFVQQRMGLHHLCLRARSREDVDRCAALLKEMDATIVRGPVEGSWAPDYYYVLFEDFDTDSIALIVKNCTGLAGFDTASFARHSLRRGDLERGCRRCAHRAPQAVLGARFTQKPRGICLARRAAAQSAEGHPVRAGDPVQGATTSMR